MMYELKGWLREKKGKEYTKKIRKIGKIPAVYYGPHLEENILLELELREFNKFWKETKGEPVPVKIILDGGKFLTGIIKEVQRHPVTGEVIHVDFLALEKGEEIEIEIPVIIKGEALGVKMGGIIEVVSKHLTCRALPDLLPPHIEVDVSELKIGETIHVKDLTPPQGVKILDDPMTPVVTIFAPEIPEEEKET